MGTYYGPDWLKDYSLAFWDTKGWLNHDYGPWTQNSQEAFDFYYQFGLFRGQFDKILNQRNRQSYFSNTGLDYSKIVDPRNALGSAPVIARSSLNWVSHNLDRLYR